MSNKLFRHTYVRLHELLMSLIQSPPQIFFRKTYFYTQTIFLRSLSQAFLVIHVERTITIVRTEAMSYRSQSI